MPSRHTTDSRSTAEPSAPAALGSFSEENRTLVEALRSDDPDVRRDALAEVVESIDDEIAREMLWIVESHPDEDFRGRAAIALGPALESCDLELDEDGNLPDASDPLNLADLSQAVFTEVQTRLRRVYEDLAAPIDVRRRALEASTRSTRPWHAMAIRAAWGSSEEAWKVTALFCMGFHQGSDWSAEIEEGLRSTSSDLQLEAVLAAGRSEISRLMPEVSVIALDARRDRVLRLAAIESLATLEGGESTLLKLNQDIDPEISEAAGEALLELDSFRRLSHLGDLDDLSDVDDLEELLDREGFDA